MLNLCRDMTEFSTAEGPGVIRMIYVERFVCHRNHNDPVVWVSYYD
jgi:hypothetical protein